MPATIIVGGGVIGLSTALMLTKAGIDATVIERDPERVPGSPGEAWDAWDRAGVAQFRQPHYLHPGGRQVLDEFLPEVTAALARADGTRFDVLGLMPPWIADRAPRPGDERFVTLTARRPVIEYAVASVAEKLIDIRRGVQVTGLLTGQQAVGGVPNVTGVRTSDGEELRADLVIDAMGRRSPLPAWLAAAEARPPAEEAEDSGFFYYTRYFRPAAGKAAPRFRGALLTHFDSFSLVTLPCDAGTWSVTIYVSSQDRALRELRHERHWTSVVAACPWQAHMLDGDPITGVLAMGGIVDRHRRLVVDGMPVATGVIAVGDSSSCTNPSLGRGITMGLKHAAGTAGVIRDHLGDPLSLALAHDTMTETRVTPWYRNTVELDRARREQITASIEGRPAASPADPETIAAAAGRNALQVAMLHDADIFRAMCEIVTMLTLPQEVMGRPGLAERIREVAAEREAVTPPGPSRADLLNSLA